MNTDIELMKEMRDEGYPLQAIGDHFGITREAVRTDLERNYGTAKMAHYIARGALSNALGCAKERLQTLEKQGKLNPKHIGFFYLYDLWEVLKAVKLVQKTCIHCGNVLPKGHWRLCKTCSEKRKHYNYPFLTDEQKKGRSIYSMDWRKTHKKVETL